MGYISKLAIIEDGAKIGRDVEISAFCVISKDTEIGDGCKLAEGVITKGKVTIGKNNTIHPYAVIGNAPQSISYKGGPSEVIIGDNNTIREFTTINAGTPAFTSKTVIGNNNFIMTYVHIAHDCVVGNNCILANNATLAGHVRLGDFVNIGGLTPIHQFVSVGRYSMIGGASALSQDIPPFCLAEGNRAKIRGVNRIGIRRNLNREVVDTISLLLKKLANTDKPLKEKAQEIIDKSDNPYEREFCEFIINSKRGIPLLRRGNEY